MVRIGSSLGRKTVAIITDMNRPLGMAIGNGLEMKEAIEVLTGKVPLDDPLVRVCMVLGSEMLLLAGLADSRGKAEEMLEEALVSGRGYEKLRAMLAAMGGDVRCADNPELLVRTSTIKPVYADKAGYISEMDARKLGMASCLLGAGRLRKEDRIDPAVGILMKKRCGDYLGADEPFAYLYVNNDEKLDEALEMIREAVAVSDSAPNEVPLVYDIIE